LPTAQDRVNSQGENVKSVDLVLSLERADGEIDAAYKANLETSLGYLAEVIYEMSNGGNYLGTVSILSNKEGFNFADVSIAKCGVWPYTTHGHAIHFAENSAKCSELATDLTSNWLLDPTRFAGVLGHEMMHYLYDLSDEYGSGEVRPGSDNYSISGLVMNAVVGTNQLQLSVSPPVQPPDLSMYTWARLKVFIEPYGVGSPIRFYSIGGALPSGIGGDPTYRVSSITIDEKQRIISLNITDAAGNPVQFSDNGTPSGWGIYQNYNYWESPFTISSRAADEVYNFHGQSSSNPLGNHGPLYQYWNLSSRINANPHNWQGRYHRRKSDGSNCSQWDVVSLRCDMLSDDGSKARVGGFMGSLRGREPQESDVYWNNDAKSADLRYLEYTPSLLFGAGTADQNFITGWGQFRNNSTSEIFNNNLSPSAIGIPYMKADLAIPGATLLARQFFNVKWIKQTPEVKFAIDYSKTMKPGTKPENIDVARLLATADGARYLKIPTSSFNVSYYNVSPKSSNYDSKYGIVERLIDEPPVEQNYLREFQLGWAMDGTYDPMLPLSSLALDKMAPGFNLGCIASKFTADPTTQKYLYVYTDATMLADPRYFDFLVKQIKAKEIHLKLYLIGNTPDVVAAQMLVDAVGGELVNAPIPNSPSSWIQAIPEAFKGESGATWGVNMSKGYDFGVDNTKKVTTLFISRKDKNPVDDDKVYLWGPGSRPYSMWPLGFPSSNATKNVRYYVIQPGESDVGIWHVEFLDDPANYEVTAISRLATDPPKAELTVAAANAGKLQYPDAFFIQARLMDQYLYTNIHVTGTITDPQQNTLTVTLTDDGLGGDLLAGDGIYTYRFDGYNHNGVYTISIEATNPTGNAIPTLIGTSYDGPALSFVPTTKTFLFHKNIEITVSGVVEDDYPAPPNPIHSIVCDGPLIPGRIEQTGDEDWFAISNVSITKNLDVHIKSTGAGSLQIVSLVTGKTFASVNFTAEQGEDLRLMSSSLEPNIAVVVKGVEKQFYSISAFSTITGLLSVGRFESIHDWSSVQGNISLDTLHPLEGKSALHTEFSGWQVIHSRDVSTSEIETVSDTLSLSLLVPPNPPNPWWLGTAAISVVIPSLNKQYALGEQQIALPTTTDTYQSLQFAVPSTLLNALQEPHSDIQILITLNTSVPISVDQLQFVGKLRTNLVSMNQVVCPEPGCSSVTTLDLSGSQGSQKISAYGDLWLRLSEWPTDWCPNRLHLSLSAEDGGLLTGYIDLLGKIDSLSNWYQQFDRDYDFSAPVNFRVHNVAGRPYRLNWWVDGSGSCSLTSNTSSDFNCVGECLSARESVSPWVPMNLENGSDAWFVVKQNLSGWQASEMQGRTIEVNGTPVSNGQMPLPPSMNGAWYFHFIGNGPTWASWSWWS